MQAVEIHSENACPVALRLLAVPLAQPFHKFDHDSITPHPRRESAEIAQRLGGAFILRPAGDITMNTKHVWPIRLESENTEFFFRDQSPGEVGPGRIKLVCAMGRFANQNERPVTCPRDQRIKIAGFRSRPGHGSNNGGNRIRLSERTHSFTDIAWTVGSGLSRQKVG